MYSCMILSTASISAKKHVCMYFNLYNYISICVILCRILGFKAIYFTVFIDTCLQTTWTQDCPPSTPGEEKAAKPLAPTLNQGFPPGIIVQASCQVCDSLQSARPGTSKKNEMMKNGRPPDLDAQDQTCLDIRY